MAYQVERAMQERDRSRATARSKVASTRAPPRRSMHSLHGCSSGIEPARFDGGKMLAFAAGHSFCIEAGNHYGSTECHLVLCIRIAAAAMQKRFFFFNDQNNSQDRKAFL